MLNIDTMTARQLRAILAPLGWIVESVTGDWGERVFAQPPEGQTLSRQSDQGEPSAAGKLYRQLIEAHRIPTPAEG